MGGHLLQGILARQDLPVRDERAGSGGAGTLYWITDLTDAYGKRVEPVVKEIDEGDFASSGKKITMVMEEERSAGNEVAIDITPGRKAIISSALLSAWQKQVDHVFYLYLEDMRNASNPYPMIPFHLQHFVDLKEEVWK